MIRVTHTATHAAKIFADPYKKCRRCNEWIDGVLVKSGPLVLVPCEHESDYRDLCPSWGPVDGCTCPLQQHEMRPPGDDGHVY